MTTTEKNKLIAEFMGWEYRKNDYFFPNDMKHLYIPANIYEFEGGNYQFETDVTDLKFHSSWDWLMPVVEKIESVGGAIHICETFIFLHFTDRKKECERFDSERLKITRIEAVYNACVEFILWYNQI